jgi:hypothetical protein
MVIGRVMMSEKEVVYTTGYTGTDLNRSQGYVKSVILSHFTMLLMLLGYTTEISRTGNIFAGHAILNSTVQMEPKASPGVIKRDLNIDWYRQKRNTLRRIS